MRRLSRHLLIVEPPETSAQDKWAQTPRLAHDGSRKKMARENSGFISLGRRILGRMVQSLLEAKALETALKSGPKQALSGEENFLFRSRLRFAKRMLQAWLWAQSLHHTPPPLRRDITQGRKSGARVPAHTLPPKLRRPHTPEVAFAADSPRQWLRRNAVPRTDQTDPRADTQLELLKAAGFRPRLRLWVRPKRAALEAVSEIERMEAGDAAKGGHELETTPQTGLVLNRHTAPFFAAKSPRGGQDANGEQNNEQGQTEDETDNAAPRRCAMPRAGQIYTDLRRMQTILAAPDAAVTRLARRRACSQGRVDRPAPLPLPKPMPPSQSWRERLDITAPTEEWWQDFAREMGEGHGPHGDGCEGVTDADDAGDTQNARVGLDVLDGLDAPLLPQSFAPP